MGILNRLSTEQTIGGATTGSGLGVEAVKHYVSDESLPACEVIKQIAPPEPSTSIDLMLFDWFFWTDFMHLNTGGLIAIIGASILIHGSWRGRKDRIKREQREAARDDKKFN